MFSKQNLIRILANTLLGGILIFTWVKLVNINEVLDSLSSINHLSVLPFFLFFAISGALRGGRLKLLLFKYKIPLKETIPLTYLSQLLSFLIPLRIGEVSKGVYLSGEYPIAFGKSILWIFLDRFFDFWVIILLAGILLFLIPTNLPVNISFLILLLGIMLTVSIIVVIFYPKLLTIVRNIFAQMLIFNVLKRPFIRITDFFIEITSPLQYNFLGTSQMFILSILALISDTMMWVTLLQAFLGPNLDFTKIWLGNMLSALTFLIPAAPGYVGSLEAATLGVFHFILGMDKNIISAAGVLYHGVTLVAILVFGISSLYFLKFDLRIVWKRFKK